MICTLTLKQQKALIKKVALDVDKMDAFNFNAYAKELHDLVLDKTKDEATARMYVSLLPTVIRVLGVDKELFRKTIDESKKMLALEDACNGS
jgi:DNA mismatch repair ATPase MutL